MKLDSQPSSFGPLGFTEISSALREVSKVFFSEIAPLKDKFLLSLQLQQFRSSVAELRSEVEARPSLLDRLAGFSDLSARSQEFLLSSRKHDLRSLQDPHELMQTLQAWHRSLFLPGVPISRAAEDLAAIVRFAEGEKQNPQLAKWLQGQLRDTVMEFNDRLMKAKDYARAHRLLNSVNPNFAGAFDAPLQDVYSQLIGQAFELENDLSTLNPSQKLKALCQLASVYRQLRENPAEAMAKYEERYRGVLEEIIELGKDPSLSDGEKIDAMMLAAVSLGTAGDPARGRKLIVELHHSLQKAEAAQISPESQDKKIAQLEKTIPTFLWLQTLIESTYSARIQEEEGKKKSVHGLAQERQKIRDTLAVAHGYLRDGKASSTEAALEKLKEDFGPEAPREFYVALGKAFEFQIPMGEKIGIADHVLQLVKSETIEDPRIQARIRFDLAKRFLVDDSLKRRAEPLVLAMLANLEVTAQATSDSLLLSDIQDLRKLKPYLQATNRVLDHVFSIEGFGIGMASMFTAGLAGEIAAFAAAARFGAASVQALSWGQRIAVGAARFGANWAAFNASETMLKSLFHLAKGEALPSAQELRRQLVTSFFSLGVGHLAAMPFASLAGSIPGMGLGRFFAFSAGMVRGEDLAAQLQGLPQSQEPFLVRFYEASLNAAFLEMGAKAGKPLSEYLLSGYAERQAKARTAAGAANESQISSDAEKLQRAQTRFGLSSEMLSDPAQLKSAFRRWIWEKRPDLAAHERAAEKADLQADLELWKWLRQRAENTSAPRQTPQKKLELGYDKDLSNPIEVVDLTHLSATAEASTGEVGPLVTPQPVISEKAPAKTETPVQPAEIQDFAPSRRAMSEPRGFFDAWGKYIESKVNPDAEARLRKELTPQIDRALTTVELVDPFAGLFKDGLLDRVLDYFLMPTPKQAFRDQLIHYVLKGNLNREELGQLLKALQEKKLSVEDIGYIDARGGGYKKQLEEAIGFTQDRWLAEVAKDPSLMPILRDKVNFVIGTTEYLYYGMVGYPRGTIQGFFALDLQRILNVIILLTTHPSSRENNLEFAQDMAVALARIPFPKLLTYVLQPFDSILASLQTIDSTYERRQELLSYVRSFAPGARPGRTTFRPNLSEGEAASGERGPVVEAARTNATQDDSSQASATERPRPRVTDPDDDIGHSRTPRSRISQEVLEDFLENPDQILRRRVADSLGNTGDPKYSPLLERALSDGFYIVQINAAAALLRLNPSHPQGLRVLQTLLNHEDSDIRHSTVRKFEGLGEKLPRLLLERALDHFDPFVQIFAAAELARLDPNHPTALVFLENGLFHEDIVVSSHAVKGLSGSEHPLAVEILGTQEMFEHPEPEVRTEGLKEFLGKTSEMEFLKEALQSENYEYQLIAAGRLVELQPGHSDAMNLLEQAIRHPDEGVRFQAVQALAKLNRPEFLPLLEESLYETSIGVQLVASKAIAKLDPENQNVIVGWLRSLQEDTFDLKLFAIEALDNFRGPNVRQGFEAALRDENDWVKIAAAAALAKMDHAEAVAQTETPQFPFKGQDGHSTLSTVIINSPQRNQSEGEAASGERGTVVEATRPPVNSEESPRMSANNRPRPQVTDPDDDVGYSRTPMSPTAEAAIQMAMAFGFFDRRFLSEVGRMTTANLNLQEASKAYEVMQGALKDSSAELKQGVFIQIIQGRLPLPEARQLAKEIRDGQLSLEPIDGIGFLKVAQNVPLDSSEAQILARQFELDDPDFLRTVAQVASPHLTVRAAREAYQAIRPALENYEESTQQAVFRQIIEGRMDIQQAGDLAEQIESGETYLEPSLDGRGYLKQHRTLKYEPERHVLPDTVREASLFADESTDLNLQGSGRNAPVEDLNETLRMSRADKTAPMNLPALPSGRTRRGEEYVLTEHRRNEDTYNPALTYGIPSMARWENSVDGNTVTVDFHMMRGVNPASDTLTLTFWREDFERLNIPMGRDGKLDQSDPAKIPMFVIERSAQKKSGPGSFGGLLGVGIGLATLLSSEPAQAAMSNAINALGSADSAGLLAVGALFFLGMAAGRPHRSKKSKSEKVELGKNRNEAKNKVRVLEDKTAPEEPSTISGEALLKKIIKAFNKRHREDFLTNGPLDIEDFDYEYNVKHLLQRVSKDPKLIRAVSEMAQRPNKENGDVDYWKIIAIHTLKELALKGSEEAIEGLSLAAQNNSSGIDALTEIAEVLGHEKALLRLLDLALSKKNERYASYARAAFREVLFGDQWNYWKESAGEPLQKIVNSFLKEDPYDIIEDISNALSEDLEDDLGEYNGDANTLTVLFKVAEKAQLARSHLYLILADEHELLLDEDENSNLIELLESDPLGEKTFKHVGNWEILKKWYQIVISQHPKNPQSRK